MFVVNLLAIQVVIETVLVLGAKSYSGPLLWKVWQLSPLPIGSQRRAYGNAVWGIIVWAPTKKKTLGLGLISHYPD